jgi:hypothetical protein
MSRLAGEHMELKHVAAIALALAAGLALGGCAADLKKAQVEVAQIADLLPGHYSNSAQAAADAKEGRGKHDAKAIDIVRLRLPLLSDYAFYAQEVSLEDRQRILSQRLYTFEPMKDGTVVQRLFTFAQPDRWRGGLGNPSVFTGMMYNDTNAMAGCELIWKKEGTKFVAANNREACRMTLPSIGTVRTDMKVELSGDELSMAELAYTPGGKLVQGNAADPFYRYERGAP